MKKAHIISHSHWDREWYLPYEHHHMLEIEFMDTLIKTLEEDPDFKSFHLDGQTIMLEDYLQVRPEKKEILKKLIKEKRIHVGPWYILQDEWLTSSEANIRNLQIGHRDAKEYGDVCKIGYFPDSFGNMGQAPQILKDANINTAVFGRGVKPTGFNNEVSDSNSYESQFSEMYWQSPDGSKVLGILFANWYNNGFEVPADEEGAKKYWEKKLSDAEKYASTNHLLFMNGCDHQPVQTDLSTAINIANDMYDNVEFIHSNFEDYVEEVNKELREDLAVIKGELRSQRTDGWYTLSNTASARIYLKQMNAKCQMLFEKLAEPLAVMAHKVGMEYPHETFVYGWKTLMQNHPHDSICGCSVDAVHREMVTRFEKAENVALYIINEALTYLSNHIDITEFKNISEDAIPFLVLNPTGFEKSRVIETEIEVYKEYFEDNNNDVKLCVKKVKEYNVPEFKVINKNGCVIPSKIIEVNERFNFDLPKDKFRKPYMAKVVKLSIEVKDMDKFSWKTFALVEADQAEENNESLFISGRELENEYVKVNINDNGSINLLHKESNKEYLNLCLYEDCGDVGNEYIYGAPKGVAPIISSDSEAKIKVLEDSSFRAVVEVKNTIKIPKSADDTLKKEIEELIEFKYREAKRSTEMIDMEITTIYTLERLGKGVKVKTSFNNEALDHRVRVLFETNINTPYNYADSIFEVAKRDNTPSEEWENPCNTQHLQYFVNVHDENCGLTIATKGLNEYEILQNDKNTIAVTIHRGVRELGDWGIFYTPEAQCLGHIEAEFMIIPHGDNEDLYNSYNEANLYEIQDITKQINLKTDNVLDSKFNLFDFESNECIWSSLKLSEESGDIIARWFNPSEEYSSLALNTNMSVYNSNVLEETFDSVEKFIEVEPYKIITLAFK